MIDVQSNLNTCSKDYDNCASSLADKDSKLNGCKKAKQSVESNLAVKITELTSCGTNLKLCKDDKTKPE